LAGRDRSAEPPAERFRVSRARLAYVFERYAIQDELLTVDEASARLGVSRERIALLVLQGRLAIAAAVKRDPEERPPRLLLRREIERLAERIEPGGLPFD
jgi:hypothetical protein